MTISAARLLCDRAPLRLSERLEPRRANVAFACRGELSARARARCLAGFACPKRTPATTEWLPWLALLALLVSSSSTDAIFF
jgi:hypothetical protein